MSETPEVKAVQRRVFRNISPIRKFYLQPRAGSKIDFILGPGQTVEAMSEAEEHLLDGMGEIVDVAKDAPAIGNSMAALNKQLAEAKAENDKLRAENDGLKKTRVPEAAPSKRKK